MFPGFVIKNAKAGKECFCNGVELTIKEDLIKLICF